MTPTQDTIPTVLAAFRAGQFTPTDAQGAYAAGWRNVEDSQTPLLWEDDEVWAIHIAGEETLEFTIPEGGAIITLSGEIVELI